MIQLRDIEAMKKLSALMGYGIGDFGLNIYWNALSVWLVFWYTTVVGLEPSVAGTIFFIGMIWDAVSDPLTAAISERVRTPFGTYRPFILFGGLIAAVSFLFLFWVPPFSGMALLAFLLMTNLVFRTAYTLVAIPYTALSSRISYDSVERTEFTGVRMFFAFLGLLFISSAFPLMINHFSEQYGGADIGFLMAAAVGSVIATIALLACFFGTREQPLPAQTVRARLSWSQVFSLVKDNHVLQLLMSVIVLKSGAMACINISLLFLIVSNQDTFASKEVVLTSYAIATMVAIPFWTLLARKIGKKKTWTASAVLVGLAGLHLLLFGATLVHGVPVQILIFGISSGALAFLLWAFLPDSVEYGQRASGQRSESVVFGAAAIVQKLAGGFMGFVVGHALEFTGYDNDATVQSAEVGANILAFLAICPALMLFLSIVPILLLPLDRNIHAGIVEKLSGQSAEGQTGEPA